MNNTARVFLPENNYNSTPAPAPYCVYKKIGGMQVYLTPAYTETKNPYYKKEGCVRIELADCIGYQRYDWQNKFVFKLSAEEITSIIFKLKNLGNKTEFIPLVHDPSKSNSELKNKGKKTFWIKEGTNNSCFFHIKYINKIKKIALKAEEIFILVNLLQQAICKIYGW